jgi:hypothetical protein
MKSTRKPKRKPNRKTKRKTFRRVKKSVKRIKVGGTDYGCDPSSMHTIKEGLDDSIDMILAFNAVMDVCRTAGTITELISNLKNFVPNAEGAKIKNELLERLENNETIDEFNNYYIEKGNAIIALNEKALNVQIRGRSHQEQDTLETAGSCLDDEDFNFYKTVFRGFSKQIKVFKMDPSAPPISRANKPTY